MDKGLLFYYDWLIPLSKLTDEEFRLVVNIMVNYHQCEFEVPSLEGSAGLALDFIIPQIDRMKEKVRNGKKGGRPKKDSLENGDTNNTNNEDFSKASANSQSSAPTDEWEELAKIANRKREALRAARAERAHLLGKG